VSSPNPPTVLVPVAPLGDIVVLAHDSISAPGNKVRHSGLDTERAPGTGVDLESARGANRLDDVAVAGFSLGPTESGSKALDVEWLGFLAFALSRPVTSGHQLSQYQFFCCEWPHAAHGTP
jgi:hypothetical protein